MAVVLYDDGEHKCVAFSDLVTGEGVQSNQFAVVHKGDGMLGFHRRYMSGNTACRYWVNMVRQLDVEWIVPQHGASFKGKEMVNRFLDWFEELECGIDLITQDNFRLLD